MDDLISRQAALDAVNDCGICIQKLVDLPPAQQTLHGYDIKQLDLIARILQKENLPPERVTEALTDIGRIVEMVYAEFMESLRKVVEHDDE